MINKQVKIFTKGEEITFEELSEITKKDIKGYKSWEELKTYNLTKSSELIDENQENDFGLSDNENIDYSKPHDSEGTFKGENEILLTTYGMDENFGFGYGGYYGKAMNLYGEADHFVIYNTKTNKFYKVIEEELKIYVSTNLEIAKGDRNV